MRLNPIAAFVGRIRSRRRIKRRLKTYATYNPKVARARKGTRHRRRG